MSKNRVKTKCAGTLGTSDVPEKMTMKEDEMMSMGIRGNYRDYNAWKDCTANTNRADREIEKLKKQKQQLE